jgi:hypothetical protein
MANHAGLAPNGVSMSQYLHGLRIRTLIYLDGCFSACHPPLPCHPYGVVAMAALGNGHAAMAVGRHSRGSGLPNKLTAGSERLDACAVTCVVCADSPNACHITSAITVKHALRNKDPFSSSLTLKGAGQFFYVDRKF